MSAPILTTKLFFPPARPNLISRPHLVEKLERGLRGPLTLISAPAGYGKTTLMTEWRAGAGRKFPQAWLSLDANDNNLRRFLDYFIYALGTIDAALAEHATPLIQSPQPPPSDEILSTLINDIHKFDRPFALTLDDYHVITTTEIHEAINFMLDHLPAQMHLVLLTRADPPLPLSRLRTRGQLEEIRAEHLRFTTTEACEFFSQVMGIDLSPADAAVLEKRSEGWVAGLQLVALSLQGRSAESVSDFIADFTGTHHYIADYLVEEVLNRQPEAVREFLLCTSILERLSGSLCDALLDGEDGQMMLERLERSNLFLTELDNERHWYRYHHLFAGLLQSRLRQYYPRRWAGLYQRAAQWCQQHEMAEEGVQYSLAAKDYKLAGDLIEKVSGEMLNQERISLMMQWMKALPMEELYSRPRLCINYAWTLSFAGFLDEADQLVQYIEGAFEKYKAAEDTTFHAWFSGIKDFPPQDVAEIPFEERLSTVLNLQHANIERFRDLEKAKNYCEIALKQTPVQNAGSRATALFFLGHIQLLNGDTRLAQETLQETIRLARSLNETGVTLSAVNYLGQAMVLQGNLRRAVDLFTQAGRWLEDQLEPKKIGIDLIRMGDVQREWNELEKAEQNIQAGLRMAESMGDFVFLREGYLARARLEHSCGNWEGAAAYLYKAEQVAGNTETKRGISPIKPMQARLEISRGDLQAAERWAKESGLDGESVMAAALHFLDEYSLITIARLRLAQGRLLEARELLARLHPCAAAAGRQGRVIEILALNALVAYAEGDQASAVEALSQALAFAEPEGYARLFIDEGTQMEELLALVSKANLKGEVAAYAGRLLGAFPARMASPAPQQTLVEPLSGRELEILGLVALGMSNQEIALKLYLATGTVKKHLNNIFGKLDAQSRTQCVARARELHLLS